MSRVTLDRPWLDFDLGQEMRVLSWAVNRPGFAMSRRILWREVRDADLSQDTDVAKWLKPLLTERGAEDAVTLLTSRNVSSFSEKTARAGAAEARCLATVGLSNAESVGSRLNRKLNSWGTINVAVRLNAGLTDVALIEALSIAAAARTAAVISLGIPLPTGLATGTGTDCIAIAAPPGPAEYAGLHTDIGAALGAAVHGAVLSGGRNWIAGNRALYERIVAHAETFPARPDLTRAETSTILTTPDGGHQR